MCNYNEFITLGANLDAGIVSVTSIVGKPLFLELVECYARDPRFESYVTKTQLIAQKTKFESLLVLNTSISAEQNGS